MLKAILLGLFLFPLMFATPAKANTAGLSAASLESTADFLTDLTAANDPHCRRRCEHHYNRCTSSCGGHHHHHGCRTACEHEYRRCVHHCHHH